VEDGMNRRERMKRKGDFTFLQSEKLSNIINFVRCRRRDFRGDVAARGIRQNRRLLGRDQGRIEKMHLADLGGIERQHRGGFGFDFIAGRLHRGC